MTRRPTPHVLLPVLTLFLASCASVASPPAATLAALSGNGSYEVMTYTDFPDVPEFGDATIYYPQGAPAPVGGVAIAPGFTEVQSHISWWGPRLASHGFAVLVLDTNDRRDRPDLRADALIAAVTLLRAENSRSGSPLNGRIDVGKMAIMGHSMGGGGVLLAANEHSDQIQAAIPFTPWVPDVEFGNITVPTLVIAGSADRIANVTDHAWRHFESIPESTTKVYLEIEGGDHYVADSDRGTDLATVGRYGIAWLKLYLDGDERYRDFIYGAQHELDLDKFSRYLVGPDTNH
jgi:dienelactone hydrolase